MSRNLGAGLLDRYFGPVSVARQISIPLNPQRFGRTVDAPNLANNLVCANVRQAREAGVRGIANSGIQSSCCECQFWFVKIDA